MERMASMAWKGIQLLIGSVIVVAFIALMLANATRDIFTKEFQRRTDGLEQRVETLEQFSKAMGKHIEQNKEQVIIQAKQNERSIEDRIKMHQRIERIEKAVGK